ncbi:NYN domain-containing protein [Chloroflexus sp.]
MFVIVSGDGGFAALAKKLHEYGKTVIGCAYRSAVNKTFQAVCDEFVWITDPEEKVQPVHALGQIGVTDSRNIRLAEQVAKVPEPTPENIVAKTREILD